MWYIPDVFLDSPDACFLQRFDWMSWTLCGKGFQAAFASGPAVSLRVLRGGSVDE